MSHLKSYVISLYLPDHSSGVCVYPNIAEISVEMALSVEYLSRLVRNKYLQTDINVSTLEEIEIIESFPWNGLHILAFLRYAIKLFSNNKHERFSDLFQRLDDSAKDCLLSGKREDYNFFFKMFVSFTPEMREFFAVPKLLQDFSDRTYNANELVASFIDFLVEMLAEILLNYGTDSSILVWGQIKVLYKELKFLLTFLGDTPWQFTELEENKKILTEIEAVADEAGIFLYSFFFTADQITVTRMDQTLHVLLRRIEMVQDNIREYCITVMKLPSRTTPNSAVVSVFIVDSVLDDLNHLMNNKADLVVDVKDQIKVLHEDLIYNRSFIRDIEMQQNKNLIECAIQLRDLAYEAEYIISSFVVGSVPVWYLDLKLSYVIEKNKLIRTALLEIKLNYGIGSLEIGETPSEVSSQVDKRISLGDEIVVGFQDETIQIASQLVGGPDYLQIVSIIGMPGLGKTTLAKKLYNNSSILYHFDKRAWCVVSQTYHRKKILIDILSVISDLKRDKILNMDDEKLAGSIYRSLKGRRYLVVMDDIWDIKAWNDLIRYFPNDHNGSRILFTSPLKDVALQASSNGIINALPFLSKVECWDLLKQKVFQKEGCPRDLQNIGKQIATNCHGLPLAVIVIASVLANMEKKESLWQEVAQNLSYYISKDPNKCNNILELSYKHLPVHLKPCFLYFGAFEEYREIPVRRLLSLWIAEGFIPKKEQKSLMDVAEKYLLDLINRSLVQVTRRRSDKGAKACNVHDLIRDMCLRIAKQENFLKVIEDQFSIYEQHHRLFIQPYSLHSQSRPFGLHIRSLLGCFSDPILIFPSLKLLRILKLSSISSNYRDLTGIQFLIHLKYLSVPWLPSSIGRLENLEFLLVQCADYIPPVLLNMPKLRHLLVGNSVSFSINCDSSQMNGLQTLSFIRIFHLKDEEILRCSPNLLTLKCICRPLLVDSGAYLYLNLDFLTQLESLKMVVQSSFKGEITEINYPKNIKKLTLSSFGLPWEKISIIGTLPNLEILKLVSDAFEGPIWKTKDAEFQKLKFLKLDRLRLEQWNSESDHFPRLEQLVLQNCSYLEEIPSEFGPLPTLVMIKVHSCGENVRNSAMRIQEEQLEYGNEDLKVIVSGSRSYN